MKHISALLTHIISPTQENPLNFFTLYTLSFNKAGFHNKMLMLGTELSSPPPLKPSHCSSPPLHNSSFVGARQQPTCRSPLCRALLVGGTAPSVWLRPARAAGANQRSKPRAHASLQSLSTDLHNSSKHPLSRKELGLEQGERVDKAREKDRLSQMRFVCEVPSWQRSWLLRLDIMGPLIHSVAALLCDWGQFIARSINRVTHHHLHHPHQHHMMAWCCFPPLCFADTKWLMLIY